MSASPLPRNSYVKYDYFGCSRTHGNVGILWMIPGACVQFGNRQPEVENLPWRVVERDGNGAQAGPGPLS